MRAKFKMRALSVNSGCDWTATWPASSGAVHEHEKRQDERELKPI